MIRMPGPSYRGPLPPLTDHEAALRDELHRDVEKLAGEIGERNMFRYAALAAAADFIETSLRAAGYEIRRHSYAVGGQPCWNLEAELAGAARAAEIVVVGAHYDSVRGSPGANDNASAVAALLALARRFRGRPTARTLRFVAFVNEEPPYFQTRAMGSFVYARGCRARREQITAMISLETIGYYDDQPGSQSYPFPFGCFYPPEGNFLAFIGSFAQRSLVARTIGSFRRHARFPSEGAALFSIVPGVSWSDHWAFWKMGYPALMITDTAPYRYPYYHSAFDTPDKLDYDRLARVVGGLEFVIAELAGSAR